MDSCGVFFLAAAHHWDSTIQKCQFGNENRENSLNTSLFLCGVSSVHQREFSIKHFSCVEMIWHVLVLFPSIVELQAALKTTWLTCVPNSELNQPNTLKNTHTGVQLYVLCIVPSVVYSLLRTWIRSQTSWDRSCTRGFRDCSKIKRP